MNRKLTLIATLLTTTVTALIAIPFVMTTGFAFFYFLFLILPLISFFSNLILSHLKGWNPYFPLVLTLSNVVTCLLLDVIFLQAGALEKAIGLLTLFPACFGSVLGGVSHCKNWLKHPLLIPLICCTIFLIIIFTTSTYENGWSHTLYLILAFIFAGLGIAIGRLDNKGYLIPLLLSLIFQSYYGFVFASLSAYTALYLLLGYSGLFIGRFWKHRRADKSS